MRNRGLTPMLRTGFMGLVAAGLTMAGVEAAAGVVAWDHPAEQVIVEASAPSYWSDINRPIALYDLAGTDFARLPLLYRAWRHHPDGAREDVLTFGELGSVKPYLQMSLLRQAADAPGAGGAQAADRAEGRGDDLADTLARLAGRRGMTASRIRVAVPIDTRLGRVEAADLQLWSRGTATPCLGFRGTSEGVRVLRIAGFACGAPARPVDRAALACAIDRIDLVSAGDDRDLRALFVAAARRKGKTCPGRRALDAYGDMLTTGSPSGWLDPDGDLPPLRGLFSAASRSE